jgi:iron(III) transport system substrate-binding protein
MRNLSCHLLMLLTLFAWQFTGCGGGDGRTTLIIYSPHGKELLSDYEQRFEAANPAVDVQWLFIGSQDVLDRLRSERSNPQADLWWGAPSNMFDMAAQEGLLQAYRPTWADIIAPEHHSAGDFWYGTYLTPECIGYNTELLNADEAPQDWDDLLDPKWRDKIIIRYPLASGSMRTIFGSRIYHYIARDGKPDGGYEWLLRLDANTRDYAANPTMMYQKLARGEGALTLWNMPDMALQRDNGYPFGFVIPRSGTPILTEGLAVVAGAPHDSLARAFYEFITTPDQLLHQAQEYYRIPARSDVPQDQLPDWIREAAINPQQLDWQVMRENEAAWMQYWDRHIKGQGAE